MQQNITSNWRSNVRMDKCYTCEDLAEQLRNNLCLILVEITQINRKYIPEEVKAASDM